MNWKITTALLVTLVSLTGCKSPQQPPAVSDLQVYGSPETNKIRITILGDVKNPGVYWTSQSISLSQLPDLAGGWTGRGEFGIAPSRALVTNPTSEKSEKKIYLIKSLSRKEQDKIHFHDGDVIRFPMILF